MKEKIFYMALIFISIFALQPSSSWARLVVTDETRSWAKKVVEQEQGLKTVSEPNTVAILDFYNKTEWNKLDPLQKGLALMLMTDLSKVKCFQLVERAKLRALCDELALGDSSLVDPQTRSRVGRLLRAENVVGGDIIKGRIGAFQLNSNLLKVPDEKIFGQPTAEGALLAGLFEMEKKLLFEIIGELKCKITPEEEAELKKPVALNLDALLRLFEAVELSDQGDYEKAEEMILAALKADPDFGLAREFLAEIKSLGRSAADYRMAGLGGAGLDVLWDEPSDERDPVDDPYDRNDETDIDRDGYTAIQGDCDDRNAAVHPGAVEICGDGIDQDCNGSDTTCPEDIDDDHDGYMENQGDCNDNDLLVNPGMTEIVGNGVDDDCNPNTSDEPPADISQPYIVDPFITEPLAVEDYLNVPGLREAVNRGDYLPGEFNPTAPGPYDEQRFPYIGDWPMVWAGPYKNGLQVVGMETNEAGADTVEAFVSEDTLNLINNSPFLAYEVQVEEDGVNYRILEMHQEAAEGELWDDINSQLQNGDILSRDNFLLEKADAQSGRVLRDRNGDWVRVQQYVLRSDEQTVQVLNVCLRSGDALSTMDFTTRFTGEGYPMESDLRHLDWASWLTTLGDGIYYKYVNSHQYFAGNDDVYPELEGMSVRFTNPANESLQESRTFGGKTGQRTWAMQQINTEVLTIVNSSEDTETYGYDYVNYQPLGNGRFDLNTSEGPGFFYTLEGGDQAIAEVLFYSVNDMGTGEPGGSGMDDIWSALSVNEGQAPNIGNNNLEIVFSNGDTDFFSQDIDVIYIPMSRMVWKEKGDPPFNPEP